MIKKMLVLNSLILLVPSVFFTSLEAIEQPFRSVEPIKEVSVDLIDFNSPTLTSATVLFTSEVCELSATLSSGRESADPVGGFRVNDGTRYLEIDFTGYNVIGYKGTFYVSAASRTIRFNGTNVGTLTRVASSGLEIKTIETMVEVSNISGLLRINANGSMGIIEITIYYQ
jgi:hypothetical protein